MPALVRLGIFLLAGVASCIGLRSASDADDQVRHRGTGRGVTVYVFDGGIDSASPELRGRVRRGFHAGADTVPFCNAHGTAVAGAIAGATAGIAPATSIVDVKVIECGTLRGSLTGLVAAVRWTIADHAARPGAALANWSLLVDSAGVIPRVDAALERLRAAGIVVIAAAGNLDRDACDMSPASSRRAFVVGSTSLVAGGDGGWREVRTPGTAWGDCVDLYARGDSVLLPNTGPGHSFIYWRGTSMAAAYASGAAAILLEQYPHAEPDSVMAMLRRAATADAVDENVPAREGRRRELLRVGQP